MKGSDIAQIRARLGLSQTALAELLETTQARISRMERASVVRSETAFALRFLGLKLSIEELAGQLGTTETPERLLERLGPTERE